MNFKYLILSLNYSVSTEELAGDLIILIPAILIK